MSGQWEVVGKKKPKVNQKAPAGPQTKEKKFTNRVKVEEVLPMSQIKNLYSSGKNNKENQKPQEKPKTQENAKKPQKPKQDKPQETKPKMQKSIESALSSINVSEFNDVYEKNKLLFPDTPIVWLKEMAQFLNMKVLVGLQDPVFGNKPEHYPLCVMPSPLRSILDKAVKEAGAENAAVFFDICLTAMANDLNKDLTALGHRFFLQCLAQRNPRLVVNNVSKYVSLRNSYQNKQSVGLAIIWALGQGGHSDLSVGIKVFQEIMLPLIEMKNYARYVTKYLVTLMKKHEGGSLTKEQYLMVLDVAFSSRKNAPTDLNKELVGLLPSVTRMLMRLAPSEKHSMYVECFLKRISTTNDAALRKACCAVLVECFQCDKNCFGTWGKSYLKTLPASAVLLNYIASNWNVLGKRLDKKAFTEVLKTFCSTNEELMQKKKKDDGLKEAVAAITKLQSTMASKSKKSSSSTFSFKFFLFWVLVPTIFALLYVDVKQNGSWNESSVHKALNNSGVYKYTNQALDRAKEGTVWLHARIEEQFPGLTDRTVEFTTPYIELGRDLSILFCNSVGGIKAKIDSKVPIVLETIETYAPGLVQKVQDGAANGYNTVVVYCTRGKEYLMTQVFVGKLAPEEIQKLAQHYAGITYEKAAECYHWMHQKISSAIK